MTADLWSPQTSGNSLVGLSSLRTQEQVPRSHNSLSMETEDKNGDFLFRGKSLVKHQQQKHQGMLPEISRESFSVTYHCTSHDYTSYL